MDNNFLQDKKFSSLLFGHKKHRLYCITNKYMGNFERGGKRDGGFRGGNGGKPSFQKKPWVNNDRGGDVPMHKAICSECSRSCEVPFRPSNGKPVFCKDCFAGKREQESRGARPEFGDRGPKRDFNDKFSPRTEFKPSPANDEVKKQLTDIGFKLERLLASMDRLADSVKKETSTAKTAPIIAPKAETTKAPAKVIAKPVVKALVANKKVAEKKVVAKKKK